MTEYENKKLMDFKAQISEMFGDYLLIVSPEHGCPVAIGSDLNFSIAASKSFLVEAEKNGVDIS